MSCSHSLRPLVGDTWRQNTFPTTPRSHDPPPPQGWRAAGWSRRGDCPGSGPGLAHPPRSAPAVTSAEQQHIATACRRLLAAYREAKDLIEIGAYQAGTNPQVDEAIARREAIDAFLRQGMDERVGPGEAWTELAALLGIGAHS